MDAHVGNRHIRSRFSTIRRVCNGTMCCRRPTLTGNPSVDHTGCTAPSHMIDANNTGGNAGPLCTHAPSVSTCTYTRYRSRRDTDATFPNERRHTSTNASNQLALR